MSAKRAFTILALYAVMQWASGVAQAQTPGVAHRVAALEANLAAAQATIKSLQTTVGNLTTTVTNLQTTVTDLQTSIVANLATCVSVVGAEVVFTGCNVHIRNGLGTTATTNGLGNLIVGYNEDDGPPNDRSGSHNLVVGGLHTYSNYGGFVAGWRNNVTGPWASVSGGQLNTASGQSASVSGGGSNTASGVFASVSGGQHNTAANGSASVSGGQNNTASGAGSSVSGGDSRVAVGVLDWAAGTLYEDF